MFSLFDLASLFTNLFRLMLSVFEKFLDEKCCLMEETDQVGPLAVLDRGPACVRALEAAQNSPLNALRCELVYGEFTVSELEGRTVLLANVCMVKPGCVIVFN